MPKENRTSDISGYAKEGDKGASSLYLMGFSFWQAWQILALSTNKLLPLPEHGGAGHIFNTLWMYGCVALGILIAIGIKRWVNLSFTGESSCAGFFALLGTCLVALSSSVDTLESAFFVVGVFLCGAGSGLLLLEWGEFWGTLARAEVVRSVCTSYAVAFPIVLVLLLLPRAICVVLIALLLLFSTWSLQRGRKAEHRKQPRLPLPEKTPPALRIYAMIVVVSIAFGFSQSFYRAAVPNATYMELVVVGLCMLAMTLRFVLFTEEDDPATMYKIALPSLAAGIVLLLIWSDAFSYGGFGLVLFAIYCFDGLIIIVGTDMAFRFQKPVIYVFGFAFFASRLASFMARLATHSLLAAGLLDQSLLGNVLVVALAIALISGFILFPVDDLAGLYRLPSAPPDQGGAIDAACESISESYGLTARESEILVLLANGRSIPYICEKLCISLNTGKRHANNIYRKLCIYNRQSLHDLVDYYRSALG